MSHRVDRSDAEYAAAPQLGNQAGDLQSDSTSSDVHVIISADNFGHKGGVMRSIARIAVLVSLSGLACESRASEDAPATDANTAAVPRITIEQPAEGAELDGRSVTIALAAENIRIAPAGDTASGTGHHHLFVNQEITAPGAAIPAGVTNVIHLGKAQTSHELTNLAPGEYTVIAVIGDLVHRRIDPQVTDTVRFRVK